MVIPVGSLVNCFGIAAGGAIGMMLGNRLSPTVRLIVFQGLGLCILVIGLQMALATNDIMPVTFSIVIGGIVGQVLNVDGALIHCGDSVKAMLRSKNGQFTQGFVSASMLFMIGSMAIIGPLDEGLTGDRSVLYSKSVIDAFAAMAFGAAFGSGVILSALPVLVMEALITIFAFALQSVLTPDMIVILKATGGILIMGIALNMLELVKIKLSNLLPALPCSLLIAYLAARLS